MAVEAEIKVELGEEDHKHDRLVKTRGPAPLIRDFAVNTIISVNPQVIVLSSMFPATGRIWEVTQIGVFGPDGHTVVAGGIADMYSGPSAGVDFPGDMASFIGSGNIPVNLLIGDHKVYANPGDRIYAWIYGLTVATSITLAGTVRDWRIEDRSETVI